MIELISPTRSSSSEVISKCLVPLCLKSNLSGFKIIVTSVAFASSAFCRSSYTKCAVSAYLSTTLGLTPRNALWLKTSLAVIRASCNALNKYCSWFVILLIVIYISIPTLIIIVLHVTAHAVVIHIILRCRVKTSHVVIFGRFTNMCSGS